jgi:hypothetical protein
MLLAQMPTLVTADLPKPKSDDEFEDLATDVMARRWRTPNITRHGRSGQRQFGVDATATPPHLSGAIAGLQYKNVAKLALKDIEAEVVEAESFMPPLAEYTIATSLDRDAVLHRSVLKLSEERRADSKFPVQIMFWDDLCLELTGHEDLVRKYYKAWMASQPESDSVIVEHRHVLRPPPVPSRPTVNWDAFCVLPKDEGPRAAAYVKLVATPAASLGMNIDGDLLEQFRRQVQHAFRVGDPMPPSWSPRSDAVELLWRHPYRDMSRHWMRGQDGSVGFATTIESAAHSGQCSLWEVTLDVLLFFGLVRELLRDRDVVVTLDFQPGQLQPTSRPLTPADEHKSPLAGLPLAMRPADPNPTYAAIERDFSRAELARPFPKIAEMLLHRWRVMFNQPALKRGPLAAHLEQLAIKELGWPLPTQRTIYVSTDGGCTHTDCRAIDQKANSDAHPVPDSELCQSLKRSLEADLARAGFAVVGDRDQPHALVARISAHQEVRASARRVLAIFTNTSFSVHTTTTVTILEVGRVVATIDVTGESTGTAQNYVGQTTCNLVDKLLAAGVRPGE